MSLKLNLTKLDFHSSLNLNKNKNSIQEPFSFATSNQAQISNQKIKLKLDTKSTEIKLSQNDRIKLNYEDLIEQCVLGQGEFAIVKKMLHKPSGRQFAVKFIKYHQINVLAENRPNSGDGLMDLEVLKRVGNKCPYLIRFYGSLYFDSNIMIITEVMDMSIDLFYAKAHKLRLKLPESLISLIAYAVLSGLGYMKKLKLIHRDVKPSNILINSNGEIKLCDFGISGIAIDSICNSFKGCQRYMAPEKIRITENGYSIKSDVWSLGISLIELATGLHPYNSANGIFVLSAMILDDDSPKLDPSLFSPSFCSFVDKCLIKDVQQRSSLDDLLADQFILDNMKKEKLDLSLALIKLVISDE